MNGVFILDFKIKILFYCILFLFVGFIPDLTHFSPIPHTTFKTCLRTNIALSFAVQTSRGRAAVARRAHNVLI